MKITSIIKGVGTQLRSLGMVFSLSLIHIYCAMRGLLFPAIHRIFKLSGFFLLHKND